MGIVSPELGRTKIRSFGGWVGDAWCNERLNREEGCVWLGFIQTLARDSKGGGEGSIRSIPG